MNQVMRMGAIALALASLAACVGAGSRTESAPSSASSTTAPAGDLSGAWAGAISEGDRKHPMTLNIKVDAGGSVTGTMTGGPTSGAEQTLANGKLQGDQLSYAVKAQSREGEPITFIYKGKVSGDQIKGTINPPGPMGVPSWEVTKK